MNLIVCFVWVLWIVSFLEVMRDFFYRKVFSYFFIVCVILIWCKLFKIVLMNDWLILLWNMFSLDWMFIVMGRFCEWGIVFEVKIVISIVLKKVKDIWNLKFVFCLDLYSCSY